MNFKRRLGSLLLTGGLLCGILTGCGASSAAKTEVIGYANGSDADVFRQALKQSFDQYVGEDPQYSAVYTDAQGNIDTQLSQVNELIAQGVDAIVISPLDAQKIVTAVQACQKADIPVVCINAKADTDCVYAGSENYDAGYMQGEYFAEILPQNAQVVYLEGSAAEESAGRRKQGVLDAFQQANRSDIQVVESQDCQYSREPAKTAMQSWIAKYSNGAGGVTFQAAIAANDQMALGAMEALEGAGIPVGRGNVLISGVDGTDEALAAVKSGKMEQTVLQDAAGQAQAAFEAIQIYMIGGTPEMDILVAFRNVTAENIDQYT